ncbi:hypothetical protein N7528_004696 [Penicillium herquei]|nr:hypothetical protein N7528_004696 [Penicillium herquei]
MSYIYLHQEMRARPYVTKVFGTNYGLTTKVPKDTFHLISGHPKEHAADNGSGVVIYREFCDNCGSFILEYGEMAKHHSRYICSGSLDEPELLPPKGEFFCKSRASWMPEIPSKRWILPQSLDKQLTRKDVFHKEEIY